MCTAYSILSYKNTPINPEFYTMLKGGTVALLKSGLSYIMR